MSGTDISTRRKVGRVQVAEIGIAHHQVGEGVGLEQVQQVHALCAAQIVEAIAVLQMLHLVFEDEVERRTELATKLVESPRPGRRSTDRRCSDRHGCHRGCRLPSGA